MKKVRLGVIGGGIDSAVGRAHCSAISLDGNYEIILGYFSRDRDKNLQSNSVWKAREITDDLEYFKTLRETLDAVLVLTPTPSHFEIVSKLVKFGLPVICEKSLAVNCREIDDLISLSKGSRPILVTFNYTGYPMVREMKARVENHKYGDIHTVHIEMRQDSFATIDSAGNPKKVQLWRTKDYEIPTVSLDLGVHVINLFEFVTGDSLNKVVALSSHRGLIAEVIDNIHALGTSNTGIQVILSYGKTFAGSKNGLKISIYGSQGSVNWSQEHPNELHEADVKGDIRVLNYGSEGLFQAFQSRYARFKVGHPIGFIEAFANLYEDIFHSIRGKTRENNYIFTASDALSGLQVLTAIEISAQESRWVQISE